MGQNRIAFILHLALALAVGALACADEQDVLREWAGLGYYARARNLKKAAMQIVRDHGGRVPNDAEKLMALPGVGLGLTGGMTADLLVPAVSESDVAWIGGLRLLVSLPSRHRFSFSVRYTRGLTDISSILQNRSMTYLVGCSRGP